MSPEQSVKLMLVEDEVRESEPTRELLEHAGFTVVVVAYASRVVEEAINFRPDIIVVDLNLSAGDVDMDGYRVVARLRSIELFRDTPIMVLTALPLQGKDEIRALRLGADDVVRKQTEYGVIEARILRLLRRFPGQ